MQTDDFETALTEECHGSGFNGYWNVYKLTNGKYLAKITYEPMNDNGYYDTDFTINCTISKDCKLERMTFTADKSTRRKYVQGQEDYYYEAVQTAIDVIRETVFRPCTKHYTYISSGYGSMLELFNPAGRSIAFMQGEEASELADKLDSLKTDKQVDMILSDYDTC